MSGAHVFIDGSQFPAAARRDLLESLHQRLINHKFHYESYKQAAKWLALHEAFSPARTDASCQQIYDNAFREAANQSGGALHLIGLGCGGGQKEKRLAEMLVQRKAPTICTLIDVSLPLVLGARESIVSFVPECRAIVCDLGTTDDLGKLIGSPEAGMARILTLFGILPNFEPNPLLSLIAPVISDGDCLLVGANLAPGPDYRAGTEKVLPQYDNHLTRDWLMTLLLDLGFDQRDGHLEFSIEADTDQLLRVTAYFHLRCAREILVFGERVSFEAGESLRVFFSYRHTPQTIQSLMHRHSLNVANYWLNDSGEEGVFLCRKEAC